MICNNNTKLNHRFGIKALLLSIVLLIAISTTLSANKIAIRKSEQYNKSNIHPYTHLLFKNPNQFSNKKNDITYNKLLVILIDFQEETVDDKNTTGNGKFLLTEDATYRSTIGSPPHNHEYFEANLEALRYYYLAASHNNFNLDYDIYPQTQVAYTLPQKMSYYNPANASSAFFVSRIEEYFKSAFELADSLDPEIDFAQYSHFMIIHAGSDWQHDVLGDTPSDIPSFFIRVTEGKEARVDGGSVLISYACNVPSTISQDFSEYQIDDYTYYTGYGALNGVMAHEFGHSLGAVDLYNTYNFSPAVGQFDIMDSGGTTVTEDFFAPGVLIEGVLPSLPGAFTRMLMFGDTFKTQDLYNDFSDLINQYDLFNSIEIAASSLKQLPLHYKSNIIKLPINQYEYILIENRSVDPDNDGGTSIKGTLNGRVVLYPTPYSDDFDTPTYEYDYLLPSFIDRDFNAIGGGILIWHIDEKVLYQQGYTGSDGIFVSNFDNNTVNYNPFKRGVKIIEADGMADIGNDSSQYWLGTPFEYFHKFQPNINQNGFFTNWMNQFWKPELTAESIPPLLDSNNQPAFYGLKDIGQPNPIMTFRLSAGLFDSFNQLEGKDSLQIPLPIMNSNVSEHVLPVWKSGYIKFYIQSYDPQTGFVKWSEYDKSVALELNSIDFEPIVADVNNDGFSELIIPQTNRLYFIDFSTNIPFCSTILNIGSEEFTTSPLFAFGKLFTATEYDVLTLEENTKNNLVPLTISGGAAKLAADENFLLLLQKDRFLVIDPNTCDIINAYILPEICTQHEPVTIKNLSSNEYSYFIMSDKGNIYKCYQNQVSVIFLNSNPAMQPTNLAVSSLGEYSPCLIFAIKDKLFAIKHDGTLLPGYPVYLEGYLAKQISHIKVLSLEKIQNSASPEIVYIKLENGGFLAINSDGSINRAKSIIDIKKDTFNQLCYLQNKLFWFFVSNNNGLVAAEYNKLTSEPILWSGFRNGNTGQIYLSYYEPQAISDKINAYAFPNPVKTNILTIRIENPEGNIEMYIYDIAGRLLYKNSYDSENVEYKDIQLDVAKYSPGIYLATLMNRNQIKRIKFAKES